MEERRSEYLDFENTMLKKAFWIGVAALVTIFAAGGNWAVSQYRINNLAIIQSVHADEDDKVHDALQVDIKYMQQEKVSNKELALTLAPLQQDLENTKEAVKRIETNLFLFTQNQQRVNEKILKALALATTNGNGSHTQ
jgi:hypothetical protein